MPRLPFPVHHEDNCKRVVGHCFTCLFTYLQKNAATLDITRPVKDDRPCAHDGNCVCKQLWQAERDSSGNTRSPRGGW